MSLSITECVLAGWWLDDRETDLGFFSSECGKYSTNKNVLIKVKLCNYFIIYT